MKRSWPKSAVAKRNHEEPCSFIFQRLVAKAMKSLVLVLLVAMAGSLFAEETPLPHSLGSVCLPTGYRCVAGAGIYSQVGSIQKGNFVIKFDFGPSAGVYTKTMRSAIESPDLEAKLISGFDTVIHGLKMNILVYSRGDKSHAIASFPDCLGNFHCTFTEDAELVDFMAIAASFVPAKPN